MFQAQEGKKNCAASQDGDVVLQSRDVSLNCVYLSVLERIDRLDGIDSGDEGVCSELQKKIVRSEVLHKSLVEGRIRIGSFDCERGKRRRRQVRHSGILSCSLLYIISVFSSTVDEGPAARLRRADISVPPIESCRIRIVRLASV